MNIGILASGGDSAGMNMCLYSLYERLYKNNKVFLISRGYSGLINEKTFNFDKNYLKEHKTDGGIIIKTSRCPEFRTQTGANKAMETYKKWNLDALIIMGGNGSLRGAKELVARGANIYFIPCTIDNDVFGSEYCIGFDTASKNSIKFIKNVDATMQSFDRIAVYETMGRDCPSLAKRIAKVIKPDYLFIDKTNSIEDCINIVKNNIRDDYAPKIILRENLIDSSLLKQAIIDAGLVPRICVIGYIQRGGKPSMLEKQNAIKFAQKVCYAIKKGERNRIIMVKNKTFITENIEKYV